MRTPLGDSYPGGSTRLRSGVSNSERSKPCPLKLNWQTKFNRASHSILGSPIPSRSPCLATAGSSPCAARSRASPSVAQPSRTLRRPRASTAVDDELDVDLLGEYRREDDEIRGIALQLLTWDIEVPAESIDVQVEDGWVTLGGEVEFQFESDAAFDDVASLYGVVGITDEIVVSTP